MDGMVKNIVTIIQARMGSTRLPGKTMKNLCGKPLLWYSYSRASQSIRTANTVIATTVSPLDDAIIGWCAAQNIPFFRGSEEDVLERYYQCAKENEASIIVRLTADNPFCDPKVIDSLIDGFLKDSADYVSNRIKTRTWPYGLDAEVFSYKALEFAFIEAREPYEREHVTPFIYRNPSLFKLREVPLEQDLSAFRLSVDYQEDFKLCEILIEQYKADRLDWREIIAILQSNPELAGINR
jgi:spore coat polysaccharide biosynthesis protein SpsF